MRFSSELRWLRRSAFFVSMSASTTQSCPASEPGHARLVFGQRCASLSERVPGRQICHSASQTMGLVDVDSRIVDCAFSCAKSAHAYQKVWTEEGSPLKFITIAQARALEEELPEGWKVYYAMRTPILPSRPR